MTLVTPSARGLGRAAVPTFKTTPPGNPTREHRTDPRSSHRACLTTHDRPNRISPADAALQAPVSAAPLSLPTSTRASHVSSRVRWTWTPLPIGQTHRRGMRSEQPRSQPGDRQPVSLHELHPAHDGTVRHRYDFNSCPITTGQEVRLHLAIAEAGRIRAYLRDSPSNRFLCRKSSLSITNGFRVPNHARHRVSNPSA